MKLTNKITKTHMTHLEKHVSDVLTELIFNMNEIGSQKYANRKSRKEIIRPQL
jgi:hypothetical protein